MEQNNTQQQDENLPKPITEPKPTPETTTNSSALDDSDKTHPGSDGSEQSR